MNFIETSTSCFKKFMTVVLWSSRLGSVPSFKWSLWHGSVCGVQKAGNTVVIVADVNPVGVSVRACSSAKRSGGQLPNDCYYAKQETTPALLQCKPSVTCAQHSCREHERKKRKKKK